MAGELIGALRVALGLDTAKFEDGWKGARSSTKRNVSAIQKDIASIKGAFQSVAGVLAGSALIAAGKRALDYASSLGEVSQQLGVTSKDLQTYRYAASQVGISQEEMDKSLAKLTRTIGEAKEGSKAQATTFRELGVSIQDANGKVYTAGDVIPKLAEALSKVKDPATRARLEVELFGKAGQKLDTLLASGASGVTQLTDEARKLGIVLSDEQIANADQTADRLAALKQVLEARIAGVVSDNADAIYKLANALAELANKSLEAVQNFQNFRNLRGLFLAGDTGAAKSLLGSASGRKDLAAETANRIAANSQKRNNPNNSAALNAALDREFKALTNIQNRVIQAGRQADKAKPAPAPTPDGALPTVRPSGGGRKGPTAADRSENFQKELANLEGDQLGLKQQITTDLREQAQYEHNRIATEQDAYEFELDTKVKAGQLNAADAERLKVVNARNAELQDTAVNWRLDDELLKQEVDARRETLQTVGDQLQSQANLARTAEERRQIELKILQNRIDLEKLSLQEVLDSHASAEDKARAQQRLDALPSIQAGETANINRQNAGPLASYFNSLPQTAAELNEAFENVAANGIQNMVDGLAQSAANVLKLKGLAGQLFNQIITDVIRLNLQQGLTGGSGGLLGGIGKLFGFVGGAGDGALQARAANAASALPGLAVGGTIGGFGGTDNNVLSINGIPRARVSANERITVHPNAGNDNGGMRVQVVKGDLFDVIVDHRADARVGAASPGIVSGASTGTQTAIQRKQSRRLA